MERSNRYDWFKGQSQKTNRDPRAKAKRIGKQTWRIVRIFLLFMLFFTSLWGCGQSFAIPANSNVARSLEFARSEDTLPAHVSVFQITSATAPSLTGGEASQLYSITSLNQNIWLVGETNGRQTNAEVAAQIKTQNQSGNLRMSDAENGANETIMMRNPGASGDTFYGDKPILYTSVTREGNLVEVPLTGSSAATRVVYATGNADNTASFINTTFDTLIKNNTLRLLSTKIDPVPATDTTPATIKRTTIYQPLTWDQTTLVANPNFPIYANIENQPGAQAHMAFRDEVFRNLNRIGAADWITNALTLSAPYNIPSGEELSSANTNLEARYIAVAQAQANALQILRYLGYGFNIDNTANTATIISATPQYMPGEGGRYTPIVTWDQAWVRGFGPFYGLVAYPVGQFQLAVLDAFPMMDGWEALISMVLVIFTLRALGFFITFRSTMQQQKMQEITLKRATIEAKYAAYKGNKQMNQRKQQELQELFKKEGVKPFSFISSLLITMPIFLSMWRVISHTPQFKVVNWLGINFSATSWRELFAGQFQYLPLMAVALGLSLLQNFYPRLLTRRRNKQRSDAHLRAAVRKTERTQIILAGVFAVIALIFTAGIQIYSIVVAIWSILQAQFTHSYLVQRSKQQKRRALIK